MIQQDQDARPRRPPGREAELRLAPVPRDFLLHYKRPIRQPLDHWANQVLEQFTAVRASRPDDVRSLATAVNLAALIEVFRGAPESAKQLCQGQLLWIGRLLAKRRRRNLYELALQPWINLGRLYRLESDYTRAHRHFAMIGAYDSSHPVCLGPCSIDAAAWDWIKKENPAFREFVQTVLIFEPLKTFFAAGAHAEALAFVETHRDGVGRGLRDFLDEAEVISLCRLQRYEEAHVTASGLLEPAPMAIQLVYGLHSVVSLALGGEIPKARALCRKIAALVTLLDLSRGENPTLLRFLEHLAGWAEALGDPRIAANLHRNGFSRAISLNDQPSQLGYSEALIRLSEGTERAAWRQLRNKIFDHCLYAHIGQLERSSVQTRSEDTLIFGRLRAAIDQLFADV